MQVKKPGKRSAAPTGEPGILLIVLAAAILCSIALMYVSFLAALLAFSLLAYTIVRTSTIKRSVYAGALFGAASSLILNFWMVTVITRYVQGSMLVGIACYISSALVLGVFFGVQLGLFKMMSVREEKKYSLVNNALFMASLWVIFEWMRGSLFSALPWLSYSAGVTQARNLYLIQPAAFGGVYLLSFMIILCSYFIAWCFYKKRWKLLLVPASVLVLQFVLGVLMHGSTIRQASAAGQPKFTAALILPGLTPGTVWNESSADALVEKLISLNAQAAQRKPDLVVWTETIVPWTYAKDDDFLEVIASPTSQADVYTLIGMNTADGESGGVLSNSVYLLDPSGKSLSRYDKQDLLTFVEKPAFDNDGSIILPFLASKGLKMRAGENSIPLQTPWGKAGLLLCNESTSPALTKQMVNSGATFLVNMGNDSWFSDHFIPTQHFYNCRLRAVESRKDIIVNNNMGAAGVIRASGDIEAQYDGKRSSVQLAEVIPNSIMPYYGTKVFGCFIIAIFAASIFNRFAFRGKQ